MPPSTDGCWPDAMYRALNRGETGMDFIEQWFGVSPDGGDGSLEVLWIAAVAVAVAAIVFHKRIATWLSWLSQRQR
jgi:hypothetical protein